MRTLLTSAQAEALFALLQGARLGRSVSTGKRTENDGDRPWMLAIHPKCATALEALGLAKGRPEFIDGREVKGRMLALQLGLWSVKWQITAKGRRWWRTASVRERWGCPEVATVSSRLNQSDPLAAPEES